MKKKEVYFIQVDGEEIMYSGDTLEYVMDLIQSYVAEVEVGNPIDITVSRKGMTKVEIDALPEI